MSNAAIDFSNPIADIEDAEKRLAEERRKREVERQKKEATIKADKHRKQDDESGEADMLKAHPTPKRSKESKLPASFPVQLATRRTRTALTLKVLEDRADRFHELFHKLKALKDSRSKQDLADEALELLFTKYRALLSRPIEEP